MNFGHSLFYYPTMERVRLSQTVRTRLKEILDFHGIMLLLVPGARRQKVSYWKPFATIRETVLFPTGNVWLLSVKFFGGMRS